MSGIEETGKKAATKVAKAAGETVKRTKKVVTDAAGAATEAVGDVAEAGLDAAKGALGAVGGLLSEAAAKTSDVVDNIADAVSGDQSQTQTQTQTQAQAQTSAQAAPLVSGTGPALAPLSARLDKAEKSANAPGIVLPILAVVGLAVFGYFTYQTIAQGDGTLFPQKKEPVAAAPAPAPAPAAASNTWLTTIGDTLKASFAWLTLAAKDKSVIVSGEADTDAIKTQALAQATAAIKAAPEGADALIIDNITVKGASAAPVGAALAALGANPDAAACTGAFAATMAGRTINFSTGGAAIGSDNASLLDALTGVATACKAHTIEIGGHTDSVGTPDNNQALSQKRADAVKAYWTGKGVAAAGLAAKGYGEAKPLDDVGDEKSNEKNRRIEFTVTAAAQ